MCISYVAVFTWYQFAVHCAFANSSNCEFALCAITETCSFHLGTWVHSPLSLMPSPVWRAEDAHLDSLRAVRSYRCRLTPSSTCNDEYHDIPLCCKYVVMVDYRHTSLESAFKLGNGLKYPRSQSHDHCVGTLKFACPPQLGVRVEFPEISVIIRMSSTSSPASPHRGLATEPALASFDATECWFLRTNFAS
jgi:hypothetical protein